VPIALALLYIRFKKASKSFQYNFSSLKSVRTVLSLKILLIILSFACLIIAIVGPFNPNSFLGVPQRQKSIYFLLDVSASMNVKDVAPNRLRASKQLIRNTARQLTGEKIGLIAFTDYAYVQCPLTEDRKLFDLFLDILDSRQFSNQGTNFRKALLSTIGRIQVDKAQQSFPQVSAIVLISDGENFSESFPSVINRLKSSNIHLITVGMGTYNGGPIPIDSDPSSKNQRYIKDEKGNPIHSRLNDETMVELARIMNSQYIAYQPTEDTAEQITQWLRQLASSPTQLALQKQQLNYYPYFLLFAIIGIMISLFMIPFASKVNPYSSIELSKSDKN
jgi:Ca-activated chloride channel homolog